MYWGLAGFTTRPAGLAHLAIWPRVTPSQCVAIVLSRQRRDSKPTREKPRRLDELVKHGVTQTNVWKTTEMVGASGFVYPERRRRRPKGTTDLLVPPALSLPKGTRFHYVLWRVVRCCVEVFDDAGVA